MLTARGRLVLEPVEIAVDVLLERQFRIYAIERRGTLWDARVAPTTRAAAPDKIFLFLLLHGSFAWDAPYARHVDHPAAFLATDAFVEGEHGRHTATFAAWGEPYQVVQIHAARDAFAIPVGDGPTYLDLPAEMWAAARAYAEATRAGPNGPNADPRELLRTAHRCGVLAPRLDETIVEDEGIRGQVWRRLAPFIVDLILAPSLKEISDTSRISLREVGRIMADAFGTLDLPWAGWRASTLAARVRIALLLLSNSRLTIDEIANRVGYSCTEALDHAFRTAGVASPSKSRAVLAERWNTLAVPSR